MWLNITARASDESTFTRLTKVTVGSSSLGTQVQGKQRLRVNENNILVITRLLIIYAISRFTACLVLL